MKKSRKRKKNRKKHRKIEIRTIIYLKINIDSKVYNDYNKKG